MRKLLAVLPLALLIACSSDKVVVVVTATPPRAAIVLPTSGPTATPAPPVDTATPVPPIATREPPTPTPAPQPTATPQPVLLNGRGQFASQPLTPPSGLTVVRLTHNGRSNFIVQVFQGSKKDYLVNEIGAYQGARPIFSTTPVTFDIQADGAWTIRMDAIGRAITPAFAGKGDNVSGYFDPPNRGPWEFNHTGKSNFIVHLYCAGGSDTVQNEIGAVSGSRIVSFDKGPCLWEVEADGEWFIRPRQ